LDVFARKVPVVGKLNEKKSGSPGSVRHQQLPAARHLADSQPAARLNKKHGLV